VRIVSCVGGWSIVLVFEDNEGVVRTIGKDKGLITGEEVYEGERSHLDEFWLDRPHWHWEWRP
jgi:hypothetical protein